MSIPYILLLSQLMLFWPAMLSVVHLAAYDWEEKQIAVDNAATVMGQSDRRMFNQIINFNKAIKGLEIPHHVAHGCKDNPLPWVAAACEATDITLEEIIRGMHSFMLSTAKMEWQVSTARGQYELVKLKTIHKKWERSESVPVHAETCSVCGLDTYIEVDEAPVRTFIRANSLVPIGVLSEVGGKSLKRDSKWNYRLKTGEERL